LCVYPLPLGIRQACDRLNNDLRNVSKNGFNDSDDENIISNFASWCRTDVVSRQIRLASMPSLASGVSMLGEKYLLAKDACASIQSDKEVITRTLQDEIHSLRASANKLQNELNDTTDSLTNERKRFENVTNDLKETRNELRDTRNDLDMTTSSFEECQKVLQQLTTVAEEKKNLDTLYQTLVKEHEDVTLEFGK